MDRIIQQCYFLFCKVKSLKLCIENNMNFYFFKLIILIKNLTKSNLY